MKQSDQLTELIPMLNSADLVERVTAIETLGEIGDAVALATLRERLRIANQELNALIVAVGKIKRRLKVK